MIRNNSGRSPRSGTSLIEVLVVAGIGGVVVGVAAIWLHGVQRGSRQLEDRLAHHLVVERLAAQFREDLHAARGDTLEQADDGLQFQLDSGEKVEYRWEDERVVRWQPFAGDRRRRDEFGSTRIAGATFEQVAAATPGEALVRLTLAISGKREPLRAFPLEARVGRQRSGETTP